MHCSALTKYRIYTYCGGPIYYGDLRYMAEKGLICCGILDCSSETFMLEEWSLGAWAELRHTCHTILYTIAYVSNICLFLLCVYTQSVALWIPINYDCTLHLAKHSLLTELLLGAFRRYLLLAVRLYSTASFCGPRALQTSRAPWVQCSARLLWLPTPPTNAAGCCQPQWPNADGCVAKQSLQRWYRQKPKNNQPLNVNSMIASYKQLRYSELKQKECMVYTHVLHRLSFLFSFCGLSGYYILYRAYIYLSSTAAGISCSSIQQKKKKKKINKTK